MSKWDRFGRDVDEMTPLHHAAHKSETADFEKSIIDNIEQDINSRDKRGDAPLHLAACDNENSDITDFLIRHGADVNAINERWQIPLHSAIKYNQNLNVAKLLIRNGADVNAEDQDGNTPLLYLVAEHVVKPEAVNLLIDSGANVNAQDKKGNTPLHFVVTWGQQIIVPILLKRGADVSIRNNAGKTALDEVKKDSDFYESNAHQLLKEVAENQKR